MPSEKKKKVVHLRRVIKKEQDQKRTCLRETRYKKLEWTEEYVQTYTVNQE